IDTCGSNFDTLLGVYQGGTPSQLTTVAANDDSSICGSGSRQSRVYITVAAFTTYEVEVDGYSSSAGNGAVGSVVLNWQFRPANDDWANATSVSHGIFSFVGTTAGATKESGEPTPGSGGGHSIWYKLISPYDGTLDVDTCSSDF